MTMAAMMSRGRVLVSPPAAAMAKSMEMLAATAMRGRRVTPPPSEDS